MGFSVFEKKKRTQLLTWQRKTVLVESNWLLLLSALIIPFPNDEILDETKLIAFADDKLNDKNDISVFDRVEDMVGKRENAGYQHFLLFPRFQKPCFPGMSNGVIVGEWFILLLSLFQT